ncbi:hypothetical protein [Dietzia sp. 179-F 9C3 NHS]|uniref:hypothetical protein n=1 Tax=Dietzia sp. 179-F 9C3 NHS TaxID=3374295 RepID=UPI003879AB15
MSTDDDMTPNSGSTGSSGSDARAAKRAQREAERAARAQRKADAARERALEAARAGGLFEGMEAMPQTRTPDTGPSGTTASGPAESDPYSRDAGGSGPAAAGSRPGPAARVGAALPSDTGRLKTLTAIVAIVAVLLAGGAVVATLAYLGARDQTAAAEAFQDVPTQATDAAREITTQMFTYDHRTVDADLAAVRERLAEPALTEFVEQSMPTVASAAKQQEASVYATVAAAAPQEIVEAEGEEPRVTVLVMLNRMVSTKESPEAASSASRLSVQMVQQDGVWKLSKVDAL